MSDPTTRPELAAKSVTKAEIAASRLWATEHDYIVNSGGDGYYLMQVCVPVHTTRKKAWESLAYSLKRFSELLTEESI